MKVIGPLRFEEECFRELNGHDVAAYTDFYQDVFGPLATFSLRLVDEAMLNRISGSVSLTHNSGVGVGRMLEGAEGKLIIAQMDGSDICGFISTGIELVDEAGAVVPDVTAGDVVSCRIINPDVAVLEGGGHDWEETGQVLISALMHAISSQMYSLEKRGASIHELKLVFPDEDMTMHLRDFRYAVRELSFCLKDGVFYAEELHPENDFLLDIG